MLTFFHIRSSCHWAGKLAKASIKASVNRLGKRLGRDDIPGQVYISGPRPPLVGGLSPQVSSMLFAGRNPPAVTVMVISWAEAGDFWGVPSPLPSNPIHLYR